MFALGDIADVVAGVGFPKDMQGGQDGDIPVFKVGDISTAWLQGKSLLNDSRNYLSLEDANSLGKCVPAGATVFAKIGEALRLNRRVMLGRDALVDNNVMGLVPKRERVAPKYLYYFMQTVDLGELSRSTTVPSIRKSDVVEIGIPVPELALQNEIVAEIEKQFSRLDEAVANLQRVKANLKRYKAAVLKVAVEGRLVETEAELARREGRSYETGEQLLQRILHERRERYRGRGKYCEPNGFDKTDLLSPPVGWGYATAEQLTDENRSITYGVIKLGDPVDNGVSVLRSSDVRAMRIDLDGVKRIDPLIASDYRRTFLDGGEVVMTVRGTLGGVAVVPPLCKGFNISREVAMLALIEPAMADVVAAFIASAPIERWLMQRAKGIAYTGINIETLKALPLPIPPLAEQRRIVAEVDRRLSIIREVEAEVDANLKRAQALRQATLARAFGQDVLDTRSSLQ